MEGQGGPPLSPGPAALRQGQTGWGGFGQEGGGGEGEGLLGEVYGERRGWTPLAAPDH